jgi:uncharacterized protein
VASKTALPALTGWVVDDANLLAPEQEAGLAAQSAELEKATGHQLVVVTIPSLHGQDIATLWRRPGSALGRGTQGY